MFPLLGVTVHLTSLGWPPTLRCSLDLLWGQLRFWSGPTPVCSCLQCPQLSELGCFFYGSFQWPFLYSIDTVCLVDHVDLICSLYSWWEGFGSSSLATLPLSFNCGFISTSACGSLFLRLPWRTWVCPCEGQVWRWCSCVGHKGSGCTRYSGELAARAKGNIVF